MTPKDIQAAKPGQTLNDDEVRGLHVRVSATGAKSFYLYYRTRERQPRRPKLGACSALALSDARRIARAHLAAVADGRDPSREKQLSKNDMTVSAFFEKAMAAHWSKRTPDYQKEVRRLYTRDIAPLIGKILVKHITYHDCVRVHSTKKTNHALAVISKLLYLAECYEMRTPNTNPCTAVEKHATRARKRFASPDEIAKVGALLEKYAYMHQTGVAFLYVLLFSGARPNEIGNATPDQLREVQHEGQTFGVLTWPTGKNGDVREVYLPPQAMAVIARLPAERKTLCGTRSPRSLWRILRKEAGCADLWIRDWRRTFATVSLGSGHNISLIGELLGHKSAQTTKIYAKLMDAPAFNAVKTTACNLEKMLGFTT